MVGSSLTRSGEAFIRARDFCLRHRADYETAVREFAWPRLENFNWALDYFDPIAAGNDAHGASRRNEDGSEDIRSFATMSARSAQVANFLRSEAFGEATACWSCSGTRSRSGSRCSRS